MDHQSTRRHCRIQVPRVDFVYVCKDARSLRPSPAASPLRVDAIGSNDNDFQHFKTISKQK